MEDGIESYMSILLDKKYNNNKELNENIVQKKEVIIQKKENIIQSKQYIIQEKKEPKSKETTNYK